MLQKMFAVRDNKALAFLQPFFSIAVGSALRAFADAVNDGKSPLSMHPEDYILYEVGTFNDDDGNLVSVMPIRMLGCGADFVTRRTADVKFDSVALKSDIGREVISNGS